MSTFELESPLVPTAESRSIVDSVCWDALTHDTGCDVMIVDEHGRLEYCNAAVRRRCEKAEPAALRDLYPEGVASERLALVRQAARSESPVVLRGMVGGEQRRTVFRAIEPTDRGVGRVLVVCRVAAADEVDAGAVRAKHSDGGLIDSLTPRELEVLSLIGRGLSTAQIAKELHRSVKTVEWHRVSLGNKLGVSNRVELARIAIRAGVSELTS